MRLSDAIAAMNVASLVPAEYGAYRPGIVDALGYFLDRLSPKRQADILAEQLALGPGTDLADRFTRLLSRCPTLHKLGQVVARDPRLAPELREHLQRLETAHPTTRLAEVVPVIRRETKEDSRVSIGRRPLAEASVAVVVPFTWRRSSRAAPVEGVFKVLRPDVVEHLEEELAIWPALGDHMEARSEALGLPPLPYRETLETVATRLVHEVQLEREQEHLARARALHADDPRVLIPEVLPLSTPRMTAMERIRGVKLTSVTGTASRRAELGALAARGLLARPFWSQDPVAEFHADPHAGNLMATDQDAVAVLDWSLVARLDAAERAALLQVALGAVCLDAARVERAVRSLATGCHEESTLRDVVADAIRQVRQGALPGFDWLQALLDRLVTSRALDFGQDLVLFRKALLSLSGVIGEMAPGHTVDRVLASTGIARFVASLPSRALSADLADGYGTHLSNADLLRFWSDLAWVPARFWADTWRDALRSRASGQP